MATTSNIFKAIQEQIKIPLHGFNLPNVTTPEMEESPNYVFKKGSGDIKRAARFLREGIHSRKGGENTGSVFCGAGIKII